MNEIEVVSRSKVPQPSMMPQGFPAKVFASLLEVTGDAALKVSVKDCKSGAHLKKRLQQLADAEHIAKTVKFSRTKDGKEYFFWLEREL